MQRLGLTLHSLQHDHLQNLIEKEALAITQVNDFTHQEPHDDHRLAALADTLKYAYDETLNILENIIR